MIDTVTQNTSGLGRNDDKVMQKSTDIFKSNSTNTFSFNEQNNKLNSDWTSPELLQFPKIAPQLKKERKIHRELYKDIINKFESRQVSDTTQRLRKYDVEINLQRMLFKNDRYIGLCRNKRKISNIFSNAFVSRLKHQGKFNPHDVAFDDMHSCKRYENHSKRYEEHYLKEIFEPNLKSDLKLPKLFENDDDFDNDYVKPHSLANQNNSVKQFASNSINDFPAHVAQQRTSTMIESNNKLNESQAQQQEQKAFDNMMKAFVSSSMPVLKPKQQIVNASLKRKDVLPAINKKPDGAKNSKVKENKEKVQDDSDDFDSVFSDQDE